MSSRDEVNGFQQRLENQLQEVMDLLTELWSFYAEADDTIAQIGIADEREKNTMNTAILWIKLKDIFKVEEEKHQVLQVP